MGGPLFRRGIINRARRVVCCNDAAAKSLVAKLLIRPAKPESSQQWS
jgi:hypothetical protein